MAERERERERERGMYTAKIRLAFLHGRSFLTGRSSWKCSKRSNRMDEGTKSAFEADENKDPEATGVPLAVFASLGWRCDKKKEKKRKEKEGDGDKKGEALGLACSGSPATVVRSDDTYLSTSCACIYAYTLLPFRVRTRTCVSRDYTNADRVYIHICIYVYILNVRINEQRNAVS